MIWENRKEINNKAIIEKGWHKKLLNRYLGNLGWHYACLPLAAPSLHPRLQVGSQTTAFANGLSSELHCTACNFYIVQLGSTINQPAQTKRNLPSQDCKLDLRQLHLELT